MVRRSRNRVARFNRGVRHTGELIRDDDAVGAGCSKRLPRSLQPVAVAAARRVGRADGTAAGASRDRRAQFLDEWNDVDGGPADRMANFSDGHRSVFSLVLRLLYPDASYD